MELNWVYLGLSIGLIFVIVRLIGTITLIIFPIESIVRKISRLRAKADQLENGLSLAVNYRQERFAVLRWVIGTIVTFVIIGLFEVFVGLSIFTVLEKLWLVKEH